MADFMVEFTILTKKKPKTSRGDGRSKPTGRQPKKRGGVRFIIITPEGDVLRYRVQLQFLAINNEAKYETMLTRLWVGKALGAKNIFLQSDSKLVIWQIKGEYDANKDRMQRYLRVTNQLAQKFDRVDFT